MKVTTMATNGINKKNQNENDVTVQPITTTDLPIQDHRRRPHPTAQAFFRALDGHDPNSEDGGGGVDSIGSNHKSNTITNGPSSYSSSSSSSLIRRRVLSLGWRNRYSQCKEYPVTIKMTVRTTRRSRKGMYPDDDDDDDNGKDGCNVMSSSHRPNRQSSNLDSNSNSNNHQQQQSSSPQTDAVPFKFTILQVQRGEIDGTYGTGATVWPAAMVLLKYLERHSTSTVRGRVVVDLGTGTGVTSISAALLGASKVFCTDGIDSVVQLARRNVQRVAAASADLSVAATTTTTGSPANGSTNVVTASTSTDDDNSEEKNGWESVGDADGRVEDGCQYGKSSSSSSPFLINNCPVYVQKYWWGSDTLPFQAEAQPIAASPPPSSSSSTAASVKKTDVPPLVATKASSARSATLILVADCVLPKLYPIGPLVDAIDDCLAHNDDDCDSRCCDDNEGIGGECCSTTRRVTPMALLSYEHRYYPDYDPRVKFRELAVQKQLRVDVIPQEEHDETYHVDDIELWRVTRIPSPGPRPRKKE